MSSAGLMDQMSSLLKDSSPVPEVVPTMRRNPRVLYQVMDCGGRPYGNCPQLVEFEIMYFIFKHEIQT